MIVYEGHGIRIEENKSGYVSLQHDLDDTDMPLARAVALAEVTERLATAAPGAERIDGLQTAQRKIAALETRGEIEIQEERKAEEAQAEEDKEMVELRAEYREKGADMLVRHGGGYTYWLDRAKGDPRYADLLLAADEEIDRQREEDRLAEEKADAIRQARDDAAEEKEVAERVEMQNWIYAYGSQRLHGLVTEEIEYGRVYRDERLALERPGWRWEFLTCGASAEPYGPSVEEGHLIALHAAREGIKDQVELVWMGEGEHVDGCDCETGEDGEPEVRGRIMLMSTFLDREILMEIPA